MHDRTDGHLPVSLDLRHEGLAEVEISAVLQPHLTTPWLSLSGSVLFNVQRDQYLTLTAQSPTQGQFSNKKDIYIINQLNPKVLSCLLVKTD